MVFGCVRDDPARKRVRKKKNIPLWMDLLFKSESTDYKQLRVVLNGVIGILVCASLYYLAWKRLNWALDFSPAFGTLFKWVIILLITFAFATNSIFRCSLALLLIGAFGQNGQMPLSMMVVSSLHDGPLSNAMYNYKIATDIIICHVDMQTQVAASRIQLTTGPLQDKLEKQIREASNYFRPIFSAMMWPVKLFEREVTDEQTEEDKEAMNENLAARSYADRRLKVFEKDFEEPHFLKPMWTSMKSTFGRKVGQRFTRQCTDIFDKGVRTCHESMGNLRKSCEDVLPWILEWWFCPKLDTSAICEDIDRTVNGANLCANMTKEVTQDNIEKDILEMQNVTKEMQDELKMGIHIKEVKMPRLVQFIQLRELKNKVRIMIRFVKSLMVIFHQLVSTLVIYYFYTLFKDGVLMIQKYKADIDFNNSFLTSSFWEIDHFRKENNQPCLRLITKQEMKEFQLGYFMSKPRKGEIKAAAIPLIKFIILVIFVLDIVVCDHYFYRVSKVLSEVPPVEVINGGISTFNVEVEGNGTIAQILRNILEFNQTNSYDYVSISKEECTFKPQAPDQIYNAKFILLPLSIMLMLQVVFSFVIKRLVIFYFLPYMFPRRDRCRVIFLYNKILFHRVQSRIDARARIRFTVKRWHFKKENDEGGWYSENSWLKVNVMDHFFKTKDCMVCKSRLFRRNTHACGKCPATFCKPCLEEMDGECYACQAESGAVNSQMTILNRPSDDPKETERETGDVARDTGEREVSMGKAVAATNVPPTGAIPVVLQGDHLVASESNEKNGESNATERPKL